jgi:hypothetical protein
MQKKFLKIMQNFIITNHYTFLEKETMKNHIKFLQTKKLKKPSYLKKMKLI